MTDLSAPTDQNARHALFAQDSTPTRGIVNLYADPITHRLLVDASVSLAKDALPAASLTQAVAVQILDGSGNQITSFGGGTQYTDAGVPPAHPVGNTIEWSDGSNWQTVSTAKPLPVTVGTHNVTNTGTFAVQATVTQATGTNLHAVLDTGSTTAVTQATAANLNATVIGTGTFVVQATLAAETTKVIGVTRTSDGGGNLITSNSTTTTAKFGLDNNILSILGTAPTTAGKLDVKGADGDVFVRQTTGTNLHAVIDSGSTTAVTQATAANLNATVVGTGTFVVQATLAAETTKVIGVIRASDGAGNLLTSNSTATSTKFGLDSNILSILGTAPTTAGKLDVKGADGDVFVRQTTGSNLHTVIDSGTVTTVSTVTNVSQQGGVAISLNAGAADTGTQRVVLAGKTYTSTGGSVASSGNNTLIGAGTNKLKIHAFSLSTLSTTAVTCIFQSGATGTELWRVVLQAATSTSTGANLSVSPPAYLFATASATLLNLNLSVAQTVHWAASYIDEV